MRRAIIYVLLMSAVVVTGCATAIRGTKEAMVVSTQPAGAPVQTSVETLESKRARLKDETLDRVYYGCAATPCEFDVPRQSAFLLRIDYDGRAPVIVRVDERYAKKAINANLSTAAGSSLVLAGAQTASYMAGAGAATATASMGFFGASFGLFGLTFDASTGALTDVGPNPVHIVMPPEGMTQPIYIDAEAAEAAALAAQNLKDLP